MGVGHDVIDAPPACLRPHRLACGGGGKGHHHPCRSARYAGLRRGDSLLEAEQDKAEILVETCELLVDYENHPGYEMAVAFFVDLDEAIEMFLSDGESWLDEHENIGPELCILLTDIRDAYCALDPEPNEEDPRYSSYDSAVSRTQNDFLRAIEGALRDYERNLAGVGAHLAEYDSLADEMYERLRVRAAYCYYLERADELRNMNNVAHRLWILYGIQQHRDLQNNRFCNVIERYIPNQSLRVDCVDIGRWIVWEIKSETHDRSSGMNQARESDLLRHTPGNDPAGSPANACRIALTS